MKEFLIQKENVGERLDKYLANILPNTTFSFIQKMLRKKNITLNDKKALGSTRLYLNDSIKIYFSEETFDKLTDNKHKEEDYYSLKQINTNISVIYESPDFLIINKPFGILSQKKDNKSISINEMAISYLINSGLSIDEFIKYRPSVLNRLDRNTGGLIICAKNKESAQILSDDIKNKRIIRSYTAILHGELKKDGLYQAFYKKDLKNNIAILSNDNKKDYTVIKTEFTIIDRINEASFYDVTLYTGKSHQIRAHSSFLGHSIINDKKYGNSIEDVKILKDIKDKLPGQYLFARKLVLKDGKTITCDLPKEFYEIRRKHGNLEQ